MRISFPYPGIKPLEVPERNLLGVFSPSTINPEKNADQIITDALAHPIGTSPLSERVRGHRDILIVVDDNTRWTPTHRILPHVIGAFKAGGVRKNRIRVMVALGTHRSMTEAEMVNKYGAEHLRAFPFLMHDYRDKTSLIHLGETETGVPIYVNRVVREVDFILGIGQIVPHRVPGFTGGGNIIQPGICGEETTGRTHWLSAQFPGKEILGRIENPVKQEIERVAVKAGLAWIVNAVMDGTGHLSGVVAGDPLLAYRAGATQSERVYRAELPGKADIVIADSSPADSELWQAAKGLYAADLVVRQGGVVILVTPCPEGISLSHPEILEFGYQTYEEVASEVQQGKIAKLTVAAHLVHVGEVIKKKASGILVCPGISKEETEKLGFIYAREPQEALDIAFSHLSREAEVSVLQRGGEILPVIK